MTTTPAPSRDVETRVLRLWRQAQRLPLGNHLFSQAFRFAAPYFRSIPAVVESVEPGRAEVRMSHRYWVRNHLGTVHAISLCNLAELAMGCVAEATVPPSHRWVPRSMRVAYTAMARGTMHATASAEMPAAPDGVDVDVRVSVRDDAGVQVLDATITIYVTRRKDG